MFMLLAAASLAAAQTVFVVRHAERADAAPAAQGAHGAPARETVPDIVKGLGIATPVTIGEADYDNLFVVTRGERPALVRLHYR